MSEEKKINKPISLFSTKPKDEKKSDSSSSGQERFNPSPFQTRPSPFSSTGLQYTSEKESEKEDEQGKD